MASRSIDDQLALAFSAFCRTIGSQTLVPGWLGSKPVKPGIAVLDENI